MTRKEKTRRQIRKYDLKKKKWKIPGCLGLMTNVEMASFYFFGLAQFFLLTTLVCRYCNVWKPLAFTVFLWCVAPLNVLLNKKQNKDFSKILQIFWWLLSHWLRLMFVYFTSLPACQILVAAGCIPCCTHYFKLIQFFALFTLRRFISGGILIFLLS